MEAEEVGAEDAEEEELRKALFVASLASGLLLYFC